MKRLARWVWRHHLLLVGVYIGFIIVVYASISFVQHAHFASYGYDLGIFDQAVWRFSRFLPPDNTVKERVILVDHLSLTLPLVAPLYWIWSDVRMLLLFQAFWLGFSGLGIYLVALRRSKSLVVAWSITIAYSVFYGMQIAVYYNFHPSIIAVGFVPWIAYFLESGKRRLMWVTVFLLLLSQENMGMTLFGLACFYVLQKKYRTMMLQWMLLGIVYTLVTPWILAHLSTRGFEFAPTLPRHVTAYVTQFFDDPNKRQVWLRSLASFGFLPLFSPAAVVALLVDLFQYFLSGPAYVRNWTPFTHHRAMLSVLLALGALEVMCRWKDKRRARMLAMYLVISALAAQFIWKLPLLSLADPAYWHKEPWMNDMQKVVKQVPRDISVAAQNNVVPHLSQRKEIYVIWPGELPATDPWCTLLRTQRVPDCWWLDVSYGPKMIVVDTRPGQEETQILETNEHVGEAIQNMENLGVLRLRYAAGTARLYDVVRVTP